MTFHAAGGHAERLGAQTPYIFFPKIYLPGNIPEICRFSFLISSYLENIGIPLIIVLCFMMDKPLVATNKRFFVEKVTGFNDWVKNPFTTQLVNDSSLSSKLMCVPCPWPAPSFLPRVALQT